MKVTDYDTIVIGGGIIGLASAYYSAAAGKRTLLIEKNELFHERGASGGNSRFFRVMYSEPSLAMFSEISYALWKQIETYTGAKLLDERPLLFFGDKSAGDTVEGDFNCADFVMQQLGVPFERFDARAIESRYPVFKPLPADYVGLEQNNSAIIQVQNALRAFHCLAVKSGAHCIDKTPAHISNVTDDGNVVTIETPSQTFTTRSLIVSLGAWTNEFLAPLGIEFDFKIWQMTIGYFPVEMPSREYPFWYEFGPPTAAGQNLFYGFPVGTDVEGCIKASCDFTFDIKNNIESCKREPDADLLGLISKHLQARFHGVATTPTSAKTCMYTMSPDYHMILGLLPGHKNISILAGESGRAFKYAPIFGRMLSQLAQTGATPYDISCMSITRPGLFRRSS